MEEERPAGTIIVGVLLALGMLIGFPYYMGRRDIAKIREAAPNREISLATIIDEEYSKQISQISVSTEISFGKQHYNRIWKEDTNSKEKFRYRRGFSYEDIYGGYKDVPIKFDPKSTVIVYVDPNFLNRNKFLKKGNLIFPRDIDGITFLSSSERDTEIRNGTLERIADIELGPISSLKFYDSEIPQGVYRDTIKEWLELSEVAGINKALAFAKEYGADNVLLKINGGIPDGIRLFGEMAGNLFLFSGGINTNSDYSLIGNLELYKKIMDKECNKK